MKKRATKNKVPKQPAVEDAHKRIARERLRDMELLGGPHDHQHALGEGPNMATDKDPDPPTNSELLSKI